MNYRTMNFPSGARFYTIWRMFAVVRNQAERTMPRDCCLDSESLDQLALNSQANDLYMAEPVGHA